MKSLYRFAVGARERCGHSAAEQHAGQVTFVFDAAARVGERVRGVPDVTLGVGDHGI